MTSGNTTQDEQVTRVISVDDDSDCPVVGVVVGWVDDETCLVEWNGAAARRVPMDELAPR